MGKGEWKGKQKGTNEYRELDREQKRQFRAGQKAAAYTPTADEWTWNWDTQHPGEAAEVREHVKEVQRKVAEELRWPPSTFETYGWSREKYAATYPLGHTPEAEAVDQVARTLFGLKKSSDVWVRKVADPAGVIVSGAYFPDALGSMIVDAAHRYGLERSQTFAGLYRELLEFLNQRYGQESTYHARTIKAELAGEFILSEPSAEQKQEAA